jgi:hypothetical protein
VSLCLPLSPNLSPSLPPLCLSPSLSLCPLASLRRRLDPTHPKSDVFLPPPYSTFTTHISAPLTSHTLLWASSLAPARYEVQIRSPLKSAATGDLIEMMLIQIQFIKRDLMAAMKAMDEILRENRFNLQVGRKDTYPALCRTFAVDRHHRRAYVYGTCDSFGCAGKGECRHALEGLALLVGIAERVHPLHWMVLLPSSAPLPPPPQY